MASRSTAAQVAQMTYDGAGDIRFLAEIGRVSFATYPSLVRQAVDYHISLILCRVVDVSDGVIDSVRKDLVQRRDYKHTLFKSMMLVAGEATAILEVENESRLTCEK